MSEDHNHNHTDMAMASVPMCAMPMAHVHVHKHGSFAGHIFPGFCFMLWGMLWLRGLVQKLSTPRHRYRASAWLPGPKWGSFFYYFEPWAKVVLPGISAGIEVYLEHFKYKPLYNPSGNFDHDNANNWQHLVMYLCFVFSGLVDHLTARNRGILPPDTDYAFLIFAFVTEGVLMVFHLKPPEADQTVHTLLVVLAFWTAAAILVEAIFRESVLLTAHRIVAVLSSGSFLFHAGYMLFRFHDIWNEATGVTMIPVAMVVHVMFWMVFVLAILFWVGLGRDPLGVQASRQDLMTMDEEMKGELSFGNGKAGGR